MGMKEPTKTTTESICKDVPNLVSSFVEAFVDFTVSGLFLFPNHYSSPPLRTRYPPADSLIAIGDLHGDLEKTKQSPRLSGLIDAFDRWIGSSSTIVQVGDVLDRGGDEIKILYLIEKLKCEAAKCGGTLISINGNHEIMNVEGDFQFPTREGLEEFRILTEWYGIGNRIRSLCEGLEKPRDPFRGIPHGFRGIREDIVEGVRAKIAALRSEGPISARFLAENVMVVVVGESVLVHGGLLPQHVEHGLERINDEVRDWIRGDPKGN